MPKKEEKKYENYLLLAGLSLKVNKTYEVNLVGYANNFYFRNSPLQFVNGYWKLEESYAKVLKLFCHPV